MHPRLKNLDRRWSEGMAKNRHSKIGDVLGHILMSSFIAKICLVSSCLHLHIYLFIKIAVRCL